VLLLLLQTQPLCMSAAVVLVQMFTDASSATAAVCTPARAALCGTSHSAVGSSRVAPLLLR
jgi:hypothetical protein